MMIQRIQSLLLLLTAVISIALFFIVIEHQYTDNDSAKSIYYHLCNYKQMDEAGEVMLSKTNYLHIALNLIITLLSLLIIFLYKKLRLQSTLCRLLLLLETALVVLILYSLEDVMGVKAVLSASSKNYLIILLPLIGLLLIYFANRAILRDNALLRSAHRLR